MPWFLVKFNLDLINRGTLESKYTPELSLPVVQGVGFCALVIGPGPQMERKDWGVC